MSIFGKRINETSNDYYNAYKEEELGIVERKDGFFSLHTVIKLETAIIIGGLIFMGYNNFFSDFSKNFTIEFNSNALFSSQSVLPKTYQLDDSELVVQLEESETDTVIPVKIKEDKRDVRTNVEILAENLDMNFSDLSLIVEIIKSEMTSKNNSLHEDKIIIGQL